jgi:DNA repair exonuclease SbcCD ATPase subunit
LSKRLDRDTQTLIDKLLGRDHKTFIQADFFGQGRERSFLALPGSEQRAVIEEILPLNSLEAWRTNAKDKLSEANKTVEAAKVDARIQTEKVNGIRTKLEDITASQTTWNNARSAKHSELQARLNLINQRGTLIEQEMALLRQSIPEGMNPEVYLKEQEVDESAYKGLISSASYQIDSLTGQIDKRQARPDICAFCNQHLPADAITKNEEAIQKAIDERDILVKGKGENQAKVYNAGANIGIAKEAIALNKKLLENAEKDALTNEIIEHKELPNPFDLMVHAYTAELEKEAGISEVLHKLIDFHAKERDHYHFWNHAFGTDLKTLMFEKICPFLEDKANQYLRELNNPQIRVSFSTTREMKSGDTKDQFCVTAATSTGSSVFELFSGAEQQLTSFAVGMALSDLAAMQVEGASQFMILDEPFTNLSPENCENIVNFITTHKVGDNSTILLISNEENLTSLIQNRIHVTKKNGVSCIE